MSESETKTSVILLVVMRCEAFGYGQIRVVMVLILTFVVVRFCEVFGPKDFGFDELVCSGDGGGGRR